MKTRISEWFVVGVSTLTCKSGDAGVGIFTKHSKCLKGSCGSSHVHMFDGVGTKPHTLSARKTTTHYPTSKIGIPYSELVGSPENNLQ